MIQLKNNEQIDGIRKSCKLLARLFRELANEIKPGVSTWELDKWCYDFIKKNHGKPACLGYEGFPATACISVNDEIIHGIPSKTKILTDGDVLSIDICIDLNGYISDCTHTFKVGTVSPEVERLVKVTRECLYKGIEAAEKPHARIQDISAAVYDHATKNGYGVIREYCGHGVGLELHEEPEIPNYVSRFSPNARLRPGMVIAIEPMITMGKRQIYHEDNGWTVVAADHKPACHWEHTIAITQHGVEILTEL